MTSLAAVLGIAFSTSAIAYDAADPKDPLNPINSVPKFEVTFTPPPLSSSPAETRATPAPDTGEAGHLPSIFDPFGLLTPAPQAEGGSRASKVAYPTDPAHPARHHRLHHHDPSDR